MKSFPFPMVWREDLRPGDEKHVESVVERSGFFNREEIGIAKELALDRIALGDKSDYCFVVAEQDEAWIGYTCYGPIPGTDGRYDLYWIAVDPNYQRMGAGRQLLEKTERLIHARGGRKIYIETSGRAQYRPTQTFYAKTGYRLVAQLPDFYADGDDKLIYEKTLAATK